MLKRTLFWLDPLTIKLLAQSLDQGHVSLTSTDTILGLLAPLMQQGFDALNGIKKSRDGKAYLILISSIQKLEHFIDLAHLDNCVVRALQRGWPGPLTVVFKAKTTLPEWLKGSDGTIALRCPNHQGLLTVLKNYDGLFSTSANLSGQPSPEKLEQVDAKILDNIDLIVLDDQNASTSASSTLIDLSDVQKGIKVLRQGAFSSQQLKEIFGDLIA